MPPRGPRSSVTSDQWPRSGKPACGRLGRGGPILLSPDHVLDRLPQRDRLADLVPARHVDVMQVGEDGGQQLGHGHVPVGLDLAQVADEVVQVAPHDLGGEDAVGGRPHLEHLVEIARVLLTVRKSPRQSVQRGVVAQQIEDLCIVQAGEVLPGSPGEPAVPQRLEVLPGMTSKPSTDQRLAEQRTAGPGSRADEIASVWPHCNLLDGWEKTQGFATGNRVNRRFALLKGDILNLSRQDAQSAERRFAWIVQLTKTITNVPFSYRVVKNNPGYSYHGSQKSSGPGKARWKFLPKTSDGHVELAFLAGLAGPRHGPGPTECVTHGSLQELRTCFPMSGDTCIPSDRLS